MITFRDHSIQLVAPDSLPKEFHTLLAGHIDTRSVFRQQHSHVMRVVFGANGAVIASSDDGLLLGGTVPYNLASTLQNMCNTVPGNATLTKASVLSPCEERFFFLGIEGTGGQSYIYHLPLHMPREFTDSVPQAQIEKPRYTAAEQPDSPPPYLPPAVSAASRPRGLMSSFQQSLDDRSRGLMGNLDKLIAKANTPKASTAANNIPADARSRYERVFDDNSDGKSYLTGIEAATVFLNSGHNKHALSRIWEQSDTNRDGRFTREEFVQAMWRIDTERMANPHVQQAMQIQPHPSPHPPTYTAGSNPLSSGAVTTAMLGLSSQPYPRTPYSPGMPPPIQTMEMKEPMICQGCDGGLIPGDMVYHCELCPGSGSTFCEQCHCKARKCYHDVPRAQLKAPSELKREDVVGDFFESVKCDGCRIKLKDGMLCWHCKRCFDPNYCKDCWKKAHKRCKHAKNGKVQLRQMGKGSSGTGEVLDVVCEVLFG